MENSSFPRMHVSLYVNDVVQTANFYNAFFGQHPEKVKKGYVKYILEKPSLIISFVENPERVQQNFGHLGFQVDSVAEMEQRLSAAQNAGLLTREEKGTNCCFATQDKFWVKDPDGVQWEVYYFHADAEFNDPHFEEETAEACCTVPADVVAFKNLAVAGACCVPSSNSACCN